MRSQEVHALGIPVWNIEEKDIEMTEEPSISMTDLYEGQSYGFVKCLTCGYESKVPDRF